MAEKLAAENRSMRGELQHVLLTTKAHSPLRATAGISHGPPEQSHVRKSGGPLSIDGVASGGAHGGGKGRMNVSGFASREGDLYCGDHDNDGVLGEGHGGVSRTGVEGRHHPGYDVPSGGDGDRPTSRGSWDRKVHAEVRALPRVRGRHVPSTSPSQTCSESRGCVMHQVARKKVEAMYN